jgi:membrane protease YdiL (CAAX protease family)
LIADPPAAGPDAGGFSSFLETIKPLLPIPVLLVLLPGLWWLFRDTWKELDDEAAAWRARLKEEGTIDLRPFVALAMCAVILTLQEYYGGRGFFEQTIRPIFVKLDATHPHSIRLARYDELYSFGWWSFTRVGGYLLPFPVWKLCFREDSLLDMGLRTRGFLKHTWIYAACLAVIVPVVLLVSRQPDFGAYYPFYKQSSRSFYDLLSWEAMYFAQFFGLEMFFRGFWLGALRRSFGSGAIFVMAVPYCMIHYGKPFLEANGAIVAGVFLGSLSMKTKSVYQGFLVHISVAALMDWLALLHRHALPTVFWPAP